MSKIITQEAIKNRKKWIRFLSECSGDFINDSDNLSEAIDKDTSENIESLINHLRLCGSIPEQYKHDSTEEKLYSKYTDNLLSLAYQKMGMKSIVITERADVADVEVFADNFDFVADAKAFRLSRTAKNQKDFKVTSMDRWKHGKEFAMVVAPIYQLPSRNSQIYFDAISRSVCVFTYSHLNLLINYSQHVGKHESIEVLHKIFEIIPKLNPTKNSFEYWIAVNKTLLDFDKNLQEMWRYEKLASAEAIEISKQEALEYLAQKRKEIVSMSHQDAIKELLKLSKIENNIRTIMRVRSNNIFTII